MDTQSNSNQNQNFTTPKEQYEFNNKIPEPAINSWSRVMNSMLFILSQTLVLLTFSLIYYGYPKLNTLTTVVIVCLVAILVNLYWTKRYGIVYMKKKLKTFFYGLCIVVVYVIIYYMVFDSYD